MVQGYFKSPWHVDNGVEMSSEAPLQTSGMSGAVGQAVEFGLKVDQECNIYGFDLTSIKLGKVYF